MRLIVDRMSGGCGFWGARAATESASTFSRCDSENPARSRGQRENPLLHVTELMLPPLSIRKAVLFCGLAVLFSIQVSAQVPNLQGGEYSLSGALNGDQVLPAASIGSDGGFLVWEDNRADGTGGHSISAIRLDDGLNSTGEVFRVNQVTPIKRGIKHVAGNKERPQVVRLAGGGALFLYEIRSGPNHGIYSRVLGTNGVFLGDEVRITPLGWSTTLKRSTNWDGCFRDRLKNRRFKFREVINHVRENAGGASVVPLTDGGALVVYSMNRSSETNTWRLIRDEKWTGRRFSTNDVLTPVRYFGDWMQDVFVQRLDAAGQRVGDEIQVNQQADYNQRNPSAAALPNGNFVVTWISESPRVGNWLENFEVGIRGRLLDATGSPVNGEFVANDNLDSVHANPSVAALASGGFNIFWSQRAGPPPARWDVYGRNFAADGAPGGASFLVNAHTAGDQFGPRAAGHGDSQLVVWTSVAQDGSREGVYGRAVSGGAVSGDEFRVNTTTLSRQVQPSVTSDGQGRVLAVWSSLVGEVGFDVLGQKYSISGGQPAVSSP